MRLKQKFQNWSSYKRLSLIFGIAVILLWGIPTLLDRLSSTAITYTLDSSVQSVKVAWIRNEIFTMIASNGTELIFAMPIGGDYIEFIDVNNGNTIHKIERAGSARGLVANQNTLFIITSTFTDAYEIPTGILKWSTRLGDGHVSVISQIDSNLLRIYYGDKLIEIEPQTGQVLSTSLKDKVNWIAGDYILLFNIYEGQSPLYVDDEHLLVGFVKGICLLNLQTGAYVWCRPEIDISNIAVDIESQIGYAIRKDLTLLMLDIQTGDIIEQTRFLSDQTNNEQIASVASIAFSKQVLVISFADSGQTFGLRFGSIR